MIIRGDTIHHDGHGSCGLFSAEIFPHAAAELAVTPSSCEIPINWDESANLSCPAGTQERRGL